MVPLGMIEPLRRNGMAQREVDVLIIGAGFAGLCMAIRLRKIGLSFAVLERAADVGGTWHTNTYPGCSAIFPLNYIHSHSN
jgi:cation diffusion facilitator CzcD-associated flavoprotein CzcO